MPIASAVGCVILLAMASAAGASADQFAVHTLLDRCADSSGEWFLVEWEPTWVPGSVLGPDFDHLKAALRSRVSGATALAPMSLGTSADDVEAKTSEMQHLPAAKPKTLEKAEGQGKLGDQWLCFRNASPKENGFSEEEFHRTFCAAIDDISWTCGMAYVRCGSTSHGITQVDIGKRMNIQCFTSRKVHDSGSANVRINISDSHWFGFVREALLSCDLFSPPCDCAGPGDGPHSKRQRTDWILQ